MRVSIAWILRTRANFRTGMGNLFTITGRINCGLLLAGRK